MRRIATVLLTFLLAVSACGGNSGSTTAEMEALIAATEDVRGLQFIEPPNIVIVSLEELAARVEEQIEEELDPTEVLVTERLYELLGLLDGSVDLGQAYVDLYAEAVGGYYDNETGEMVIAGGEDLSPLSKTIVVHELIHALTDQHFGFGETLDQLVDDGRYHEASALQALVEGDALYYQLVYMQTLPTDEQVAAVQESLGASTTVQDSLPDWFSEDLTWPYDAGFLFVQTVISDRDVPGLNQTYTLLPTTTEQIIHPGAYFNRQPGLPIELPDATIDGYDIFEEGEWGEWNLELLLLDGVLPGESIVASTGWGGDEYRIYWNGTDLAFAYLYQGDSTEDTTELAGSLATSLSSSMAVGQAVSGPGGTTFGPGDDYAAIGVAGSQLLLVAATNPMVGASLFEQLQASLVGS
jgi:Zn-dependent peptidase ImmA (M78 family)